MAPWPSGKAEACKAFIPSSNLGGASKKSRSRKRTGFYFFHFFAKLENRILVLIGFVKNVDLNKYRRFKAENYSIIEENMIKCKVI